MSYTLSANTITKNSARIALTLTSDYETAETIEVLVKLDSRVIATLSMLIPASSLSGDTVSAPVNELKTGTTYIITDGDQSVLFSTLTDSMPKTATLSQWQDIANRMSNGLNVFDTVADMKNATNLIDGSFAKTLGYYTEKDGGEALYKISTSQPISGYYETNGTLYFLLINNTNTPEQFGCKGDNIEDDTANFQKCLNFSKNIQLSPNKIYKISNGLNLKSNQTIDGNNSTIYRDSATTFNYALSIEDEENIKIRNLIIKSNSNKTPVTISTFPNYPESQTSNIVGIRFKGSEDVNIENVNFYDCIYCIYTTGTSEDDYLHNNNIYANNIKCYNTYNAILASFTNNLTCSNFTIRGKDHIPSGFHLACYINQHIGKVILDKFDVRQNGIYNRGPAFEFGDYSVEQSNDHKEIQISNFYVECSKLMNCYKGGNYYFTNGKVVMKKIGYDADNFNYPSEQTSGDYCHFYLDSFDSGKVFVSGCDMCPEYPNDTFIGSLCGSSTTQTNVSSNLLFNNCKVTGLKYINIGTPISYEVYNSLLTNNQTTVAINASSGYATVKKFFNSRIEWYNRNSMTLAETLNANDKVIFSNVEYDSTHANNNAMIYSTNVVADSLVVLDKVNVIGTNKIIDAESAYIITNYCSIEYVPLASE